MANNPLAGVAVGAATVTLFLCCWQVLAWLIGLAGIGILAARAYHSQCGQRVRAWVGRLPMPIADLLAGAPFLLILAAVWLLK